MDLIYRFDPFQPVASSPIADAQAALAKLQTGNDRFADIVDQMQQRIAGDLLRRVFEGSARGLIMGALGGLISERYLQPFSVCRVNDDFDSSLCNSTA